MECHKLSDKPHTLGMNLMPAKKPRKYTNVYNSTVVVLKITDFGPLFDLSHKKKIEVLKKNTRSMKTVLTK